MNSELSIAMHALVFLNRKQCTVSSEGLAKSVCTNPARIRKVMARLKAHGLVGAKEGAVGGYYMVLPPEDITLNMLLDALEVRLITSRIRANDMDVGCVVASGMETVLRDLEAMLNEACYKSMRSITIADIDGQLRGGEETRQKAE